MSLRATLSSYWCAFQEYLFPTIEADLGPLGERYQAFITVLEFVRVEQHLPGGRNWRGRPLQAPGGTGWDAFIAKAVFQIDTTRALRERLTNDPALRRLCGWESIRAITQRGDVSRAFAGFAEGALPSRLHEALIKNTMQDQLVRSRCHAMPRRSRGAKSRRPSQSSRLKPKRKRGRSTQGLRNGLPRSDGCNVSRQSTLPEMLDGPRPVMSVTKRNAHQGYKESWIGYKLHIDAGDGGIPLSGILTSASVNDSQVGDSVGHHERARTGHQPVRLMDAAYDAAERERTASRSDMCRSSMSIRATTVPHSSRNWQEAKARRALGQVYAEGGALPGAVDWSGSTVG